MKTCICIVGMHRSGTSAVTRVLNLLGVYLGDPDSMMAAHPVDNPTGYWELLEVEALQRRILADVGLEDVSPEPLPGDWRERESTIEGMAEIRKLVKRSFASRDLWGLKDPRTSILLPLWQEVLDGMGVDLRYVIVLRNPLHVAASEGKRSGSIDTRVFQLAWHYYMLSALSHTRGAKRGFVSYHDLIVDWRTALRRSIQRAELPLSVDADSGIGRAVDQFLQPSLERSASASTVDWAASFVAESFDVISRVARDGESAEDDSRIQDLLDQYVTVAGGVLPPFTSRLASLEAENRRALAEVARRKEELDAIHGSLSWKLTAPFRAALQVGAKAFGSRK